MLSQDEPLAFLIDRIQPELDELGDGDVAEIKRAWNDAWDEEWTRQKKEYLSELVDGNSLSFDEIAAAIGSTAKSSISAMKNGIISLDRFFKVVDVFGKNAPVPPAADRKAVALMSAMHCVRHNASHVRLLSRERCMSGCVG